MQIKNDEVLTIAGVNVLIPSGRKWWQFWKPRKIDSGQPQLFRVVSKHHG